jgi:serine/threonine protein kinase
MSPSSEREEALFAEALARPESERAAFLDRACAGDATLRARLAALFDAHAAPSSALDELVTLPAFRSDERPGDQIGRYKLLEILGEGGCGIVYLADQKEPVRRRVALKVIKLGMDSVEVVARFEAERQALALMDHPNIANVLDAGTTDTGRPYFVMELVSGSRITAYCDEHRLSLTKRLELFIQVCHAIQHAHQKGIIHRDIKPSNILVTEVDGVPVPKVIDFGIAKATQGQLTDRTVLTAIAQFVGTPAYMSPEQAEFSGRDIDTRSDIYSLGVLLYEMIAGRPPFDPGPLLEAGLDEVRRHIREVEPPRPSTRLSTLTDAERAAIAQQRNTEPGRLSTLLRSDLDWIVMRCLEKDRTRRYDTANGLANDIQRYLNHEPVTASPPSAVYRLRKLVVRHKVFFASAAAVMFVLLAGSVVSTWQAVRAVRAERLASARLQAELTARQDADTQRKLAVDRLGSAQAAQQEAEKARTHADEQRKVADEQRKVADEQRVRAEASLKAESAALRDSEQQKALAEKERRRALAAEKSARDEAAISAAVNQFLQDDLLRQADSRAQAEAQSIPDPDLKVRDALDRAAERVENRFQKQPLVEAAIRDTIGRTYLGLGAADKAAPQFERAVALRQTALGSDHPDTLSSMHYLGAAYTRLGRFAEAEATLTQTLEARKRTLGEEQIQTLATITNLAAVFRRQGRTEEASALLASAQEISKRVNGPNDPRTLTIAGNLATIYAEQGKPAKATSIYFDIYTTQEAVLQPTHPDLLATKNSLANLYMRLGETNNAAKLIREVCETRKQVLGPEHPETLSAMNDLASVLRAQRRLDESAALLNDTIETRRRVLGPDHPDTLVSISNLACTYWSQGRRDEATALFADTARGEERALGPANPDTLCSQDNLARAYYQQGRLDDAANVFRQTFTVRQEALGRKHRDTFHNARNLGTVYLNQKKYAEAEQLLLQWCYQQLSENDFQDLVAVQLETELLDITGLLASLYTGWGDAGKARDWTARYALLSIKRWTRIRGDEEASSATRSSLNTASTTRMTTTSTQSTRQLTSTTSRPVSPTPTTTSPAPVTSAPPSTATPTPPAATTPTPAPGKPRPAPGTPPPASGTVTLPRPSIPFNPTPPAGTRRPEPGTVRPPSSGSPRPPAASSSSGSSGTRVSTPSSSGSTSSSGSSGSRTSTSTSSGSSSSPRPTSSPASRPPQ